MSDYYPPGGLGELQGGEERVEFRCGNPECVNCIEGITWETWGEYDMGRVFLYNDDKACCPECGQEGTAND